MSIEAESIEQETTVKELLQEILKELKILNIYNSLGHDEVITEEDIEEKTT
jgi:hypothetical protein